MASQAASRSRSPREGGGLTGAAAVAGGLAEGAACGFWLPGLAAVPCWEVVCDHATSVIATIPRHIPTRISAGEIAQSCFIVLPFPNLLKVESLNCRVYPVGCAGTSHARGSACRGDHKAARRIGNG